MPQGRADADEGGVGEDVAKHRDVLLRVAHASAWSETMVQGCWLVLTELLLQALWTSRGPDGGLRVAPSHGSLRRGARA